MKLIRAKFKSDGVGVMVELWQSIYKENYYRTWTEDDEMLFADEAGKSVEWIRGFIEFCLEKHLFDRKIYTERRILTSHGIQKRYFKIVGDLGRTYIDYVPGVTYPKFWPAKAAPEGESSGESGEEMPVSGEDKNIPEGNCDFPEGKADFPPESSPEPPEESAQTEQNRTEQNRKEQNTNRTGANPPEDTPEVRLDELKAIAARLGAAYTAKNLEKILARLNKKKLPAAFVAYAYERSCEQGAVNPYGYALNAILHIDSWVGDFLALRAAPERPPPPVLATCPGCASPGPMRPFLDGGRKVAICQACGHGWIYDGTSWIDAGRYGAAPDGGG
jgi:hypothetical protein